MSTLVVYLVTAGTDNGGTGRLQIVVQLTVHFRTLILTYEKTNPKFQM